MQASTTGNPISLLWTQPLVGVSADNVLFRVSDFVYISGGFSFNKGPVKKVDVRTGLTSVQATTALAGLTTSATEPANGSLARNTDGSIIWNSPVQTIDFGLTNVDVFVGYTNSLTAAADDGDLTQAELNAANAIGVFLDEVNLGMVLMKALPVGTAPALTAAQLSSSRCSSMRPTWRWSASRSSRSRRTISRCASTRGPSSRAPGRRSRASMPRRL